MKRLEVKKGIINLRKALNNLPVWQLHIKTKHVLLSQYQCFINCQYSQK